MAVTLPTFPATADILNSAQNVLKNLASLITNLNDGGVAETILESIALALGSDASTLPNVLQPGAYESLTKVQSACFILSASGPDLDNKAADVGVTRKALAYASGFLQLSIPTPSSTDTVIPVGTLAQAESSDPTALPIVFATTTLQTIPAGQTVLAELSPILAVVGGSSGNVGIGAINQIVSGPYGLLCTNPAMTSGGADVEGDDEPNGGLRARALAAVPNAAQCTVAAIELDARSYPGVTSALLLENLADDGVTFEAGHGQLLVDNGTGALGLDTALINQIQADLNSGLYRGAGTTIRVTGAVRVAVASITLGIVYNADYTNTVSTLADVVAAVQAAIVNYGSGFTIGQPLYIAEIIALVMDVPGVVNVPPSAVLINGANLDLIPLFNQTLILELSVITVTFTKPAAA